MLWWLTGFCMCIHHKLIISRIFKALRTFTNSTLFLLSTNSSLKLAIFHMHLMYWLYHVNSHLSFFLCLFLTPCNIVVVVVVVLIKRFTVLNCVNIYVLVLSRVSYILTLGKLDRNIHTFTLTTHLFQEWTAVNIGLSTISSLSVLLAPRLLFDSIPISVCRVCTWLITRHNTH